MKGLIVSFNGKSCKAGNPDFGISLHADITPYNLSWSVAGLKFPEEESWIWNGGDLKLGDELVVEFAEFEEASEPVARIGKEGFRHSDLTEEETWQRKLDTYNRLKDILNRDDR